MPEWISTADAAELLGVSARQVQRSLQPDERIKNWGTEGVGWRLKPLSRRPIYQVSREAVDEKLKPKT